MKRLCKCGKLVEFGQTCSCQSRKEYMKEYNEKRGDSEKLLRSTKWRRKRELIKKRDNYMCQRCFIKYGIVNSEELQVHHIKPRIKYPELMFEDTNLICICGTCNRQLSIREQLDFNWSPQSDLGPYTL